jgi:SAM-dependent methyltransferase
MRHASIEAWLKRYLVPHFVAPDNPSKRQRLAASLARGRIVDLGCCQLPNPYLSGDVVGLDVLPPASPSLPPNYGRFILCDALAIEDALDASTVDTLVALEVIEHLPDHCRFFDEAQAVLRPGGMLILSTPNPYHYLTLAANSLLPAGLSESGSGQAHEGSGRVTFGPYYGHIHLHAPRILNLVAEERGFSLVKITDAERGRYVPFVTRNLFYCYMKDDDVP